MKKLIEKLMNKLGYIKYPEFASVVVVYRHTNGVLYSLGAHIEPEGNDPLTRELIYKWVHHLTESAAYGIAQAHGLVP